MQKLVITDTRTEGPPAPPFKSYITSIVVLFLFALSMLHYHGAHTHAVQEVERLRSDCQRKVEAFCFDLPSNPVNTAVRLHSSFCVDMIACAEKDYSKEIFESVVKCHTDHIPLYKWMNETEMGRYTFDAMMSALRGLLGWTPLLVPVSILCIVYFTWRAASGLERYKVL
jgi:hypothetical protein